MMATCNVCKDEGKAEPFSVPWDQFGKVFMEEHFNKDHPGVSLYETPKPLAPTTYYDPSETNAPQ